MVRKIIQPWWIWKQIALTVARLPSWGLRCCRPREPLSEPRRGEFRRRAANTRANRTGNDACQEIVFEFIMAVLFYALCFTMRFRLHIAKSSWLAGGVLKRNSPFRPNYKTRKNRDTVTVVNFRHCASVFFVLYTRKLMRKALVLKPVCVHWRCGRLFPASV